MMRAAWASALRMWVARGLLAVVIGGVCPFAHATPAKDSRPLTILGVRFGGDTGQTRMVIETDRPLSTRLAAGGGDPVHIVFVIPDVWRSKDASGPPLDGGGFGVVKTWRVDSGPHGSRLVLAVTRGAEVTHRFALPPVGEAASYRYVIDFGAASAPNPSTETAAAAPPSVPVQATRHTANATKHLTKVSSTPRAPSRLSPSARMVIVVDAGHGGHDPGAQSADLNEKDITLAAAQALRARLERDGRYRVVMTRDSDVFIPLETRVQIARRAGADLFISLHADSAGGDPDTHGASVYTLSDHGETRVTEVLGPREWFTRTGTRATDPAVGRILLDLTQRSTLNRSAVFAGLLIDRVSEKIDLLPRTHRDAGYFVLLAPDVPAVLLEMGFISSPRDQVRLTDPAERAKLTNAVADAIDAYFDAQPDHAPATHKTKTVVRVRSSRPPQLPATQPG